MSGGSKAYCADDIIQFFKGSEIVFDIDADGSPFKDTDNKALSEANKVRSQYNSEKINIIDAAGYRISLPMSDFKMDTSGLDFDDISMIFCLPSFETNYYGPPKSPLAEMTENDTDALFLNHLGEKQSSSSLLEELKSDYLTSKFYRFILPYRFYDTEGVLIPYKTKEESTSTVNYSWAIWVIVILFIVVIIILIIAIIVVYQRKKKNSV